MVNTKGDMVVKRADLIALLNLAQTDSEDWTDEYDRELGRIARAYGHPNIPKPVIEGEFEVEMSE